MSEHIVNLRCVQKLQNRMYVSDITYVLPPGMWLRCFWKSIQLSSRHKSPLSMSFRLACRAVHMPRLMTPLNKPLCFILWKFSTYFADEAVVVARRLLTCKRSRKTGRQLCIGKLRFVLIEAVLNCPYFPKILFKARYGKRSSHSASSRCKCRPAWQKQLSPNSFAQSSW